MTGLISSMYSAAKKVCCTPVDPASSTRNPSTKRLRPVLMSMMGGGLER
jgi:hypothetical protein